MKLYLLTYGRDLTGNLVVDKYQMDGRHNLTTSKRIAEAIVRREENGLVPRTVTRYRLVRDNEIEYEHTYEEPRQRSLELEAAEDEEAAEAAETFLRAKAGQGHVHAELMAQYAEDARVHAEPWKLWKVKSEAGTWGACGFHPLWRPRLQYLRKPQQRELEPEEIAEIKEAGDRATEGAIDEYLRAKGRRDLVGEPQTSKEREQEARDAYCKRELESRQRRELLQLLSGAEFTVTLQSTGTKSPADAVGCTTLNINITLTEKDHD